MDITLFILFLTISHVSILQINSVIAVNPSGFSLKIIHSDSKESPLYPGDHLTAEERLQRLVKQSKDRARYVGLQVLSSFNKTTNSINPDAASIPVSYEGVASYYVAEIGIGTFPRSPNSPQPFKTNYLMVDTGSQIIWTQCAGAAGRTRYFHQDQPLYPAGNSRTYEPLRYQDHHPLCYQGQFDEQGLCTYLASYPSSVSIGVLAKETFTVNSDNYVLQSFDIIMGCGFRQTGFGYLGSGFKKGIPDRVTGILGLSSGPRSLRSQLRMSTFSYCLKPFSYGDPMVQSSYLRFGSDATIGEQAFKTPIGYPSGPDGSGQYLLNLEGISVNGIKVPQITSTTFQYNPRNGQEGFFIDSGSPFTVMHQTPFHYVAERVVTYFIGLGFGYDASMVPWNRNLNVLGAMQQAGKRILYDTQELSLSFISEEC
ncbi:aspartic proteinase nepenthesin-1-like [Papaver somniferum]|uniref:aspartic proteinase nepenthesin-1-like n=1 Tax=Papaver somniferum TaxID=3469 RepID=UPI000E705CEA|nr:aspartic proteinase nepenthesin-1-like [Papaver somniferum]